MLSDEWLPRYRLLENFNIKWNGNGNGNENGNGNGNAYDRGDYNSSFALRAIELRIEISFFNLHDVLHGILTPSTVFIISLRLINKILFLIRGLSQNAV